MDIFERTKTAIQEEQERRKADKQYQLLNRAYVKSLLRVIPGGKGNAKPENNGK